MKLHTIDEARIWAQFAAGVVAAMPAGQVLADDDVAVKAARVADAMMRELRERMAFSLDEVAVEVCDE